MVTFAELLETADHNFPFYRREREKRSLRRGSSK